MGITNRAGALYMATGIDNTGLYKGKKEAMGLIKAMAGEVTSFDVFGGIGVSAAVAFAKAAKDAYTFEKDFQKSMYEVASISGTIKGSLTDYMNSIIEMTRQIPVAANDSAKALYQIVSAGHDGADAMKILEVSAKAAVGGVTDTATAADAITTVLNAYKMSASEASNVSDMLFMTAKLGKTTMGELGQTIAQAAPIAASYGVGIEQVLSAVASLTKQGTPTAQAMTQIRASIIGVSKVLGDGAYDGRTYQEALAEVAACANGSESELRKLVPEIEAVNAVLGMTGNNANAAASDLGQLQNSLGASEAAFKTMQKSADNQLKLLQNNITATLRPLGEDILKEVAGVAQKMNDAFNNGDMENSLQTMETLIKLVSVAFVGYKVATLDVLKTTNAEAAVTKMMATIKASYHKVIGDGIIQKETERLSQEAYIASLESSITAEQRAALEKQNLKKGSKEYADALSEIAVNAKNCADQEVESLTKSLEKNRDKLASAKERVEMSKEATEAAKEELNAALQSNDISATEAAQSKVISAAKREESATNDMNTVSRKINNQEKRLGIAQTRADSASTVLNSATTAGNAAAATVSSRAHNFLAAAKLKASIATRTLTAAMAANQIGALLTVVSLAASAWFMFGGNTEKAKTKLQEFREEQDKLKESTNNLLNILYDTNEADRIRIEALEKLKEMYPDVWKGVTLENLALKDRNKTLKETNTLRDKEAELNLKNKMNSLTSSLAAKKAEAAKIKADMIKNAEDSKDVTREMGDFIKTNKEIETFGKELKALEKQYYATQASKQKLIEESLPVDTRISIYEKELKDLQAQIEKATGAKKEFSLTDWGESPKLPTFEDMPKFSDQFNLQLLENQARETKEKLETAKKSKETGKKSGTGTSLTEDQKREAEKRKSTMEDIAKTVLGVELKLQQDRVALMADGREKALAEIEADKKARLQAIDESEKELKKKYASTGQSMPKNVANNYTQQRETVNTDAGYKTEAVNKDYDRQEIEFQKELTSVYLTEEETRKQAIQGRYDAVRRTQQDAYDGELRNIKEQNKAKTLTDEQALDATLKATTKYAAIFSQIDNAQSTDEIKSNKEKRDSIVAQLNDYKSQEYTLSKEWGDRIAEATTTGDAELIESMKAGKKKALSELNAQMLQQSDEWVKLFGNMDDLTISEIENLVQIIKEKAKDMKLDPINLDAVFENLEKAEETIRTRNPFKSLANSIKDYKKAEGDAAKKDALKDILKDTAASLDMVKSGFDSVVGGLTEMGLAGDEETQKLLGSISGMVGSASELASGIASMNPVAMISGAVGLITSVFDVFDSRSRKANREIKKHAENLKDLQRQYKELERASNKAIGEDKYKGQIEQARNYQDQIREINGMISSEQSKKSKKRDDGKIDEWRDQISELKGDIEDLKQGIIDELSTTDIYSYAGSLASSIVEGFCDGIDDASGIIDGKLKELMRNVISKQFDVMVIQKAMKPMFDAMADGFDINSEKGFGLSDKELDDIVSAGEQGKEQISGSLDGLKKTLERLGLLNEEANDSLKEGVTGQLQAAMTEGTASQLVGLWNMTALDIRAIKDLTAEHFRQAKPYMLNVESVLAETRQINANTKRGADNTDGLIEKLQDGFSDLKKELSDIKSNTKSYNGRG